MTLLLTILKKLLTIYDYWMQIKQLVRLGIVLHYGCQILNKRIETVVLSFNLLHK